MDPLNPTNVKMMQAFENIFSGQGDPMVAASAWFFHALREQRRPQEPTVFANDLLTKAMALATDNILNLCNDMALASRLNDTAIKQLKKQVFEVVRIRNNLAIMLDQSEIGDPRQFDLFGEQPLSPGDFHG